MKRKMTVLAAITGVTLAASITGCATESGTVTKNDGTQSEAAVETVTETEQSAEPESSNPHFGDTYTWPDGLEVTISQPVEYTPSEYAVGAVEGETALAYDVTITNGTKEDVESLGINFTVASGGQEGTAIFDTDGGVEMPTSTILPGKSLTWKIAYSVADPTDVQISVDNLTDFSSPKVHFTS